MTVPSSAIAVASLWAFCGLCVVAMVVTAPPVADRIWNGVATRVEPRLSARDETVAASASAQEFQIAVAQVAEELEYAKPIVQERDHNYFYTTVGGIPMRRWDQHGATLAGRDAALHRCVAQAYLRIDELNRNLDHIRVGHDEWESRVNDARADSAFPAIGRALDALEKAQP
jgi:hypothetical protein